MRTLTITTPSSQREVLHLDLDSGVPLSEHINRGRYGDVNSLYKSDRFRLDLSGPCELALFDLEDFASFEELIASMKAEGYVHARIDHALAMGAQHPLRQKRSPVSFLGTVLSDQNGDPRVPVLDDWSGERELTLGWLDSGSSIKYGCFAAVRES